MSYVRRWQIWRLAKEHMPSLLEHVAVTDEFLRGARAAARVWAVAASCYAPREPREHPGVPSSRPSSNALAAHRKEAISIEAKEARWRDAEIAAPKVVRAARKGHLLACGLARRRPIPLEGVTPER